MRPQAAHAAVATNPDQDVCRQGSVWLSPSSMALAGTQACCGHGRPSVELSSPLIPPAERQVQGPHGPGDVGLTCLILHEEGK